MKELSLAILVSIAGRPGGASDVLLARIFRCDRRSIKVRTRLLAKESYIEPSPLEDGNWVVSDGAVQLATLIHSAALWRAKTQEKNSSN
jgi:hypothetical protein